MAPDHKKRPRRIPLSPEEVATIIALKKRRELVRLHHLKKSNTYKILNYFNIACFFVYFELLFCFVGSGRQEVHVSLHIVPKYGDTYQKDGKPIVSDIDVMAADGRIYNFVVDDFIKAPASGTKFFIISDYLLNKDLKGRFFNSLQTYRLFSASPILFLCLFILVISSVAMIYNLNENAYSLMSLSVLNALTLSGILVL